MPRAKLLRATTAPDRSKSRPDPAIRGEQPFLRQRPLLPLLGLLLISAVPFTNCSADVDRLVDVEVAWAINGVDDPALCQVYSIDDWVVFLRGPESIDVTVDCQTAFWTTDTALFAIFEGTYDIDVVAIDSAGAELTGLTTTATLVDRGLVETIFLDFRPSDFQFALVL